MTLTLNDGDGTSVVFEEACRIHGYCCGWAALTLLPHEKNSHNRLAVRLGIHRAVAQYNRNKFKKGRFECHELPQCQRRKIKDLADAYVVLHPEIEDAAK